MIEHGAAVIEADTAGFPSPLAWAGRHRVIPAAAPDTTELRAVMTPFYAVLEARRQAQTGTSVGSVLLSAHAAIADGDRSLAATFTREHGVSLRFFPAGQGPRDSSVFEICTPTPDRENACQRGGTLFSVLTIPPSQGDAKIAALPSTAWLPRPGLGVLVVGFIVSAAPG